MGRKVHITDHAHRLYSGDPQSDWRIPPLDIILSKGVPVIIDDNVWLADGVIVLLRVSIGIVCIIGANRVVSNNIPDYLITVGLPAKCIKRYDDYEKNCCR